MYTIIGYYNVWRIKRSSPELSSITNNNNTNSNAMTNMWLHTQKEKEEDMSKSKRKRKRNSSSDTMQYSTANNSIRIAIISYYNRMQSVSQPVYEYECVCNILFECSVVHCTHKTKWDTDAPLRMSTNIILYLSFGVCVHIVRIVWIFHSFIAFIHYVHSFRPSTFFSAFVTCYIYVVQ